MQSAFGVLAIDVQQKVLIYFVYELKKYDLNIVNQIVQFIYIEPE